MGYICTYIRENELHFLMKGWLLKGEFLGLLCTVVFSLCVTFFAYKIRKKFRKMDVVNTGITCLGYDPTIATPLISLVFFGCAVYFFNAIGKIVENCNLSTRVGLLGIVDYLYIYPSLSICLFLLLTVLVSLVLAVAELCTKRNKFAVISLIATIIQGLIFYCSLPDYENSQKYEQKIIEYKNFK